MKRYTNHPRVKTLIAVQRRLKQDQVYHLAAMLAYRLIVAVIPVLVLLLSVEGLVPHRRLLPEQLMAFEMLAFFIVLVPVLFVISLVPGLLSEPGTVQSLFGDSQLTALCVLIVSVLAGWFVASMLFLLCYIVIPNRLAPVRLVWKGAVIAGALLEIVQQSFPVYAARFLNPGNATVSVGIGLAVIVFFHYFGLVLLLGAEINTYFFDRDRQSGS
jgi:membrane protein